MNLQKIKIIRKTMTTKTDEKTGWHVVKDIPLAFIFTIMLQTCAGVWWAATLTTKLDTLNIQIIELKTDRYTSNDARRDLALQQAMQQELARRIDNLEKRIKH